MQAAGYTLDVYCDSPKCPDKYRRSHGTGEYVSNARNCRREAYSQARKDGWKLARRGGIDLCPACSGKKTKPITMSKNNPK